MGRSTARKHSASLTAGHAPSASMSSLPFAGPSGFAPSSTLRPALPLSIDVSLARIALPPSSLLHKPPMVLPIAIDTEDEEEDVFSTGVQDCADNDHSLLTAPAAESASARHFSLNSAASSPSLHDLHACARLQAQLSAGAYSSNSAGATPRPDDALPVPPTQQQQQRRQSSFFPQPQQEVLALLSASSLDSAGIISSSPCSSSPAMSRSSRRSGTSSSAPTNSLLTTMPAGSSSSSSATSSLSAASSLASYRPSGESNSSTRATTSDSHRPFYHRSPSVTSFASDGSWHGDAGDWDPESQLKSAAEKVSAATQPRQQTSCGQAASSSSSSSNPIFRSIGAGFGIVSSRVAARHQGLGNGNDDVSDEDQLSDDDNLDDDDDDKYSATSNSLFFSVAPSRGGSFSYSQSECAGGADSSSATSCSGRSFTSVNNCSAAHLQYLRFKAIGHGLTPLKPTAVAPASASPSPTKVKERSVDEDLLSAADLSNSTVLGGKAAASPHFGVEKDSISSASSADRARTAKDSIREHAGPFIWLLTSLLDPISRSGSGGRSGSGSVATASDLSNSIESSPDLSLSASSEEDLQQQMGQTKWTQKLNRRSKEEYLFGPRSAWSAVPADAEEEISAVAGLEEQAVDMVEPSVQLQGLKGSEKKAQYPPRDVIDIGVDGDFDLNAALDWPSAEANQNILDSLQNENAFRQPELPQQGLSISTTPPPLLGTGTGAPLPSSSSAILLSPLGTAAVAEHGFGFGYERDTNAFATAAAFLLPSSAAAASMMVVGSAPTPPPAPVPSSVSAGGAAGVFGLGLAAEITAGQLASVFS